MRKKLAGEGTVTVGGAVAEAKPKGKKEHIEEEKPRPSTAATEAVGVDDVSMDSAWQSIVRSGAARPVAVRKSETWGGEELLRRGRWRGRRTTWGGPDCIFSPFMCGVGQSDSRLTQAKRAVFTLGSFLSRINKKVVVFGTKS